jgi:hypothetical protein
MKYRLPPILPSERRNRSAVAGRLPPPTPLAGRCAILVGKAGERSVDFLEVDRYVSPRFHLGRTLMPGSPVGLVEGGCRASSL